MSKKTKIITLTTMFTTLDGAEFRAANALELCHQLRAASRDPRDTFEEFLYATAEAAELYNGKSHRSGSAEALVSDLEASGLITVEEPQDPNFPAS